MSHTAPSLTSITRLLIACMDKAGRWSPRKAAALAVLLLVVVVGTDWTTGAAFNLGFLYLVVCVFVVWCLGETTGLAFSLLCAAIVSVLRHLQIGHGLIAPGLATEAWNFVARSLSFCLVAAIVSGLRGALTLERWRGSHDELTGALNRSGFQRGLEEGVARQRGRGGNLLLAYMDLDGFKAVNDRFGHAAGDHVLRALAEAARGAIRRSDLFARVGGDEFALLLFLPEEVDGQHIAALIHARLTTLLEQAGFDVTCSMGAVLLPADQTGDGDAIIEQADAVMYEVKQAGKNAFRVVNGGAVGQMLRNAFPLSDPNELDELLRRIDLAERRQSWTLRRAA